MKSYIQSKVSEVSYFIEMLISLILVIVIIVLTVKMLISLFDVSIYNTEEDILNNILGRAMTLAIGVEFIKMLCTHIPKTVIEVLLFAIARQMVIGHASSLEALVGVVSITVLFATRKYLFCSFDETEKSMYRGSQRVKMTNMLARIEIPAEDGETLREVISNRLSKEQKTIAIGSCVYYKDFALRIASMREGMITRVEVIKSV